MKKFTLNIKSPWAFLISLCMFVTFFTVVALADDDTVIGYTHDGLPVLESDVPNKAQLSVDRALQIEIKGIKKVKTKVLNVNTLEMAVDEKVYTIIVDCKLTEIDNFQWQTRGDGSLDVGDFGFARRNPFKYFDNPALELSKEQVEAKLEDWDLDTRTCIILALQLAGTLEEEENGKEN